MNIFKQEIKMMRVSTFIWLLVLCGILLMYISLYPAFSSDAELTRKMFSHVPPAMKAAVGINFDTMLSFLGFLAFIFTNVTLFASVHAMYVGVSILSRESRSKTTEFLLAKPCGRKNIFVQKYLAGLSIILITWIAMVLTTFGLSKIFEAGDFSMERFGFLMLALLILQAWFFNCGILATQLFRRMKSVIPTTLSVVLGFFLVSILAAILNDDKLRYFSPFKFFNFIDIVGGKNYELSFMLVAAVSFIVMLITAGIIYVKRDARAVA